MFSRRSRGRSATLSLVLLPRNDIFRGRSSRKRGRFRDADIYLKILNIYVEPLKGTEQNGASVLIIVIVCYYYYYYYCYYYYYY